MGRTDVASFASTLVHELRTPLSVVSGEVDLALARERTPAAYRDALMRIGERVAELVDLTSDFALLGDARQSDGAADASLTLHALFAILVDRFGPRRGSPVLFDADSPYRRVAGDEVRLAGALSLIVEHAVRHRRDGARVRLRALPPELTAACGWWLSVDAPPSGFSTGTWHALSERQRNDALAHGQLRLETAMRLIRSCGGSVAIEMEEGSECVRIALAPIASGGDAVSGESTA